MPQRSLAAIADAVWAVLPVPALTLEVVLAAEPPSSEPPPQPASSAASSAVVMAGRDRRLLQVRIMAGRSQVAGRVVGSMDFILESRSCPARGGGRHVAGVVASTRANLRHLHGSCRTCPCSGGLRP